jgi:hypothetical protein
MTLCRFTCGADDSESDWLIGFPVYSAPVTANLPALEQVRERPLAATTRKARVGDWFAEQRGTFTAADLCEAFGIKDAMGCKYVAWGLAQHLIKIVGSHTHPHGGWTREFRAT